MQSPGDGKLTTRGDDYRFLDRPQKLGILPTWSFWNRREVWKNARVIVAPGAGLISFGVIIAGVALDAPLWAASVVGTGAYVAFLGLFERYVRRRAGR